MFDKKPHIKFDKRGLIPAIIRDARSQEVINLVYMDRKALKKTQESGKLWLYNRSMKKVWMKGQRSGDTVDVEEIRTHVDKYSLLIEGVPNGSACHTGESSCFPFVYWRKEGNTEGDENVLESFKAIFGGDTENSPLKEEKAAAASLTDEKENDGLIEFRERGSSEQKPREEMISEIEEEIEVVKKTTQSSVPVAEKDLLGELYWSIADRAENPVPNSPISRLSQLGIRGISKHLGQDVMDVTMASLQKDRKATLKESIDLLRHWILLLLQQGITLSEIYEELEKQV